MHTFLMVLLWVVLGLLALLAVLLIVPAAVAVEYKQGEFTARLKLLGIFSFRLYPMKEKADRKKKKTPPRPESAPKEQPAKPEPKLHPFHRRCIHAPRVPDTAFYRHYFYPAHTQGRCGADGCRLWQSAGMGGRSCRRAAKFFQPELQAGAHFG